MNNDQLHALLQELKVPAPDEDMKAKALHRATIALASPDTAPEARPLRFPWLTPALAALVILMGAYILFHSSGPDRPAPPSIAAVLQEMEALFPNRISALIWRNGELTVELAEPSGTPGNPVEIVLTRDNDQIRVISYSGREVCVNLGGQQVCFEVLLSGTDDSAILLGQHYIWTPQNPASLEGFEIQVTTMNGGTS